MCITNSCRLYLFATINSNLENTSTTLGDISAIGNSTYNSVEKLLQYYINNGYLPDVGNIALIPTMTSNTAPSGVASSSTIYSADYAAWKSLNNAENFTCLLSGTSGYFQYEFPIAKVVRRISFAPYKNTAGVELNSLFKNFSLVASNDGVNYTTLFTGQTNPPVAGVKQYVTINNSNYYRYYKIIVADNWGYTGYTQIGQFFQMYGYSV